MESKGCKFLNRQPVYLLMFGYMMSLESLPGVTQQQGIRLFMKKFELEEDEMGVKEETLLREFGRMKKDFLQQN